MGVQPLVWTTWEDPTCLETTKVQRLSLGHSHSPEEPPRRAACPPPLEKVHTQQQRSCAAKSEVTNFPKQTYSSRPFRENTFNSMALLVVQVCVHSSIS